MFAVYFTLLFVISVASSYDKSDKLLSSFPLSLSSPAGKHASTEIDDLNLISNIAVFLLGSMVHGAALGEKPPIKEGNDPYYWEVDYFSRIIAAKQTWARHAPYFFMVTGGGDTEKRVLQNSSYCNNHTHVYRRALRRFREYTDTQEDDERVNGSSAGRLLPEIYTCQDIRVLHLRYCKGTSWGPGGPCCRCEGAMKFFLGMQKTVGFPEDHEIDRKERGKLFPEWFIFSDDDYYVRLKMLSYLVERPEISFSQNYVFMPIPIRSYQKSYGLSLWNKNCSVPCVHKIPWLGFGMFSVGLLRTMEKSLRARGSDKMGLGGLVQTCQRWDVTHDIGLGIFTWTYSPLAIPLLGDADLPLSKSLGYNTVLWHHVPKAYDLIFNDIWIAALNWYDKNQKQSNSDEIKINREFDISVLLAYEKAEALSYRNQHPIHVQMKGFESSMYHRILSVLSATTSAMSLDHIEKWKPNPEVRLEQKLERKEINPNSVLLTPSALVMGQSLDTSLRMYTSSECDRDCQTFRIWLKSKRDASLNITEPISTISSKNTLNWADIVSENIRNKDETLFSRKLSTLEEYKICVLYATFVSNTFIDFYDKNDRDVSRTQETSHSSGRNTEEKNLVDAVIENQIVTNFLSSADTVQYKNDENVITGLDIDIY